ncbi:MAG TPA: hypothetical protein PKK26_04960 [Candidatus Wallbacteria bacterium]|nr:hypothetical protein [Candidatus Wallbacteria bacterium]
MPRNIYDYVAGIGATAAMEVAGEKFLHCANINAQVKLLAGLFSKLSKEKASTNVKYCDKFVSRDIMACFENFRSSSLKMTSYSYDVARFGNGESRREKNGEKNTVKVIYNVSDFLRSPISGEVFPSLSKNLADNLAAESKKNLTGLENEILIIGTAYPLYYDIWKYFSDNQVYINYVEFCDICMRSLKKKNFLPSDFFNMGIRAARVNHIVSESSKKGRRVKILHIFPKFSHYEIEDSFFSKNINADYLSFDYAGGGALSARDKIRLETFIKM